LYFAQEALGGAVLGLAVGYLVYRILRTIDEPQVEILITLATVVGGYALAHAIGVSGPLAMVVIGLIIGNQGRRFGMSAQTRELLDGFWRTIDTILNAVLFVLIGLQFAVIAAPSGSIVASALVTALCVLARYLVVGLPMKLVPSWFGMPARAGLLVTWGGLRGGISVALALSLPAGPERGLILMLTYSVVVFSILVQGLTVGRLARSLALRAREDSPGPHN
jgi:CPA1 family monovalent cation:H+ antiporter